MLGPHAVDDDAVAFQPDRGLVVQRLEARSLRNECAHDAAEAPGDRRGEGEKHDHDHAHDDCEREQSRYALLQRVLQWPGQRDDEQSAGDRRKYAGCEIERGCNCDRGQDAGIDQQQGGCVCGFVSVCHGAVMRDLRRQGATIPRGWQIEIRAGAPIAPSPGAAGCRRQTRRERSGNTECRDYRCGRFRYRDGGFARRQTPPPRLFQPKIVWRGAA